MKPITLHPVSVLAGIVLAGALFVVAGAAQSHGTAQSIPSHDVRLVGEIPAEWWTFVRLTTDLSGTPTLTYLVPNDRYLVVTYVQGNGDVRVGNESLGDNVAPLRLNSLTNLVRCSIPPGSLVTAGNGGGTSTLLWGYLEPVR